MIMNNLNFFKANSCVFFNFLYFLYTMPEISNHNFTPVSKAQSFEHINHFAGVPYSLPFWPASFCMPPPIPQNHSYELLISRKNIKKTRNIKLPQKCQPTDDKIKKINSRRGKYKRSTNNSHKKFICVARRLLMKLLNVEQRQRFEIEFQSFKNSRTYYFIILAHAKFQLSKENLQDFKSHFLAAMNCKMEFYKKQVDRTDNRNFINFRFDEIADIRFAIRAFELYFEDHVEEAIEAIYKKDKATVLKKHQYEQALETVRDLQNTLQLQQERPNGDKIFLKHQQLEIPLCKSNNPAIFSFNQAKIIPETSILLNLKKSLQNESQNWFQNQQQISLSKNGKYPLLELQNSYPIYEHFFPIIYPYQWEQPRSQVCTFPFMPSFLESNQFGEPLKLIPIEKTELSGCPQPWENNTNIKDVPVGFNQGLPEYECFINQSQPIVVKDKNIQFEKLMPGRPNEVEDKSMLY